MRCFRMFTNNVSLLNQLNMLYARACICSLLAFTILVLTAYGSKIKTKSAFFDEVFYQPSLAVKSEEILWWRIHVCYNKCVHANHLIFRFFNITYYVPFIRSWSCFAYEFAINCRRINFVIFGDFIKFTRKTGCFLQRIPFSFRRIAIACAIFFTLLIKIRRGETAVTMKQNTDCRIIFRYSSSTGCRKSTTPVQEYCVPSRS